MLVNLKLSARLLVSFAIVLVLSLIMAGIGIWGISTLEKDMRVITKSEVPNLVHASEVLAAFLRVNQIERTFMAPNLNATQRQQLSAGMDTALKELDEGQKELEQYIDGREEREIYDEFRKALEAWRGEHHKRIMDAVGRRDDRAAAGATPEELTKLHQEVIVANLESRDASNGVYKILREKYEHLLERESQDLMEDALKTASYQRSLMLIVTVLGTALAATLALVLSRSLSGTLERAIGELVESSEQIRSASGELSSASQELSEAASEQAGALEETSASLHEMTSMMESSVESETQASTMLDTMNRTAEDSNATMNELVSSMNTILDSNEKIRQLVNVISAIGEQTEVIDEIVFQTKLLSFNASVEAERAGEHGRGFAVVAQEVGNLAEMSSKAAAQISSIVKDSIRNADQITTENKRKVEQGHQIVVSMAQVLKSLAEKSATISNVARQNTHTAREQLNAISQINTAMAQLDQATQQNAGIAEESAAASEELNAQAEVVTDLIERLQKLVDGANSTRHATAKVPSHMEKRTHASAEKPRLRTAPTVVRSKPARPASAREGHVALKAVPMEVRPTGTDGQTGHDNANEQWEKL